MKLKVLFLSLCLLIFSGSKSFAILFDLAGQGGTNSSTVIEFNMFDWAPAAALLKDINLTAGDEFNLYAHASLAAFQLNNSNVALPSGYTLDHDIEVTLIMGYGEIYGGSIVNDAPGNLPDTLSSSFSYDKNSPLNFFEIYLDDTPDANPLSGEGFNDGHRIAWGTVAKSWGSFSITGSYNNSTNTFSPTLELLDQNGNDDWNGKQSVVGLGSSYLMAKSSPLQYDPNYFINLPDSYYITYEDVTSVNLPFRPNTTDPSKSFDDGSGGKITLTPNDLGPFNGWGNNILLKTDGSSTISAVPEPATMFLFGSGLIGFVGIGRRKLKRKKV